MSRLDFSSSSSLSAQISGATLGFAGRVLFDGLTMTLEAGRWTCLLGSTGVGKTSLLRLFAGLVAPDNGQVVTCGDGGYIAGRVAYMAQQDLLMPWLTVIENVVIGSRLRGARPAYERARELLSWQLAYQEEDGGFRTGTVDGYGPWPDGERPSWTAAAVVLAAAALYGLSPAGDLFRSLQVE